MKQLLPLAALGAVFFALSGCATYPADPFAADGSRYDAPFYRYDAPYYVGPHYGYDGYYGYEPPYSGYYGVPYDGYYRPPYAVQRPPHRPPQVQPAPHPTPRPADPFNGPGARYQRPDGPDRDPVDPRFAPGGRP